MKYKGLFEKSLENPFFLEKERIYLKSFLVIYEEDFVALMEEWKWQNQNIDFQNLCNYLRKRIHRFCKIKNVDWVVKWILFVFVKYNIDNKFQISYQNIQIKTSGI